MMEDLRIPSPLPHPVRCLCPSIQAWALLVPLMPKLHQVLMSLEGLRRPGIQSSSHSWESSGRFPRIPLCSKDLVLGHFALCHLGISFFVHHLLTWYNCSRKEPKLSYKYKLSNSSRGLVGPGFCGAEGLLFRVQVRTTSHSCLKGGASYWARGQLGTKESPEKWEQLASLCPTMVSPWCNRSRVLLQPTDQRTIHTMCVWLGTVCCGNPRYKWYQSGQENIES